MRKLNVADWFFLLLLTVITVLYYAVLRPFFIDIFLAFLLVSLFWKVNLRLRKLPYVVPRAASVLTIAAVLLIVIMPFMIIGVFVVEEAREVFVWLQENWVFLENQFASGRLQQTIRGLPFVRQLLETMEVLGVQTQLGRVVAQTADFMINGLQEFLSELAWFFFHLFIVIVLMYFLFLQGDQLAHKAKRIIPLAYKQEDELLGNIQTTVNAVIIGSFVTGLINGVIGGSLFYLFGVPSPLLWGFVMFVFAFLPVLGDAFVYIAAGIYKIALGASVTGLLLIIAGFTIPEIIEHLVRPKVVGESGHINPGIVIISTFGGIVLFGFWGIVIGPVVAVLFISAWEQFSRRFPE